MSNCNTIVSVLSKNGSDQKQRYIDALDPKNTALYEFEVTDWILFAYHFAGHVNYFETTNDTVASGDWKAFFDYFELEGENPTYTESFDLNRIKDKVKTFIKNSEKEHTLTPHLTLFITFLMLLEKSKERCNTLTRKHLDFYYDKILGIKKQPATPDKVYMIFELAKSASQQKLEAGIAFDGGKDAKGKSRTYYSANELIANKATVGALKNVYHDGIAKKIVAAPVANSIDGLGKAFPDGNGQWWPFGHANIANALPDATLGFAIASPVLALKEGKRSVEIAFTFENNIENANDESLLQNIAVQLTTEKKWHTVPGISSLVTLKSGAGFATSFNANVMKIAFELNEDVAAITNYNAKILGPGFDSELPVAKFILNTSNPDGYELYRSLAQNKLLKFTINIDVQNIKNAALENDNSTINASKPFYPFTAIPVKGSNFIIKYAEAFSKNWKNIDVGLSWKNTPEDFSKHYKAYKTTSKDSISIIDFEKSFVVFPAKTEYIDKDRIVTSDDYFTYDLDMLSNNIWLPVTDKQNQVLFQKQVLPSGNQFTTGFSVPNNNADSKGSLKMTLNNSFLHSLYPKVYAMALATENKNIVLPNEPYTPLAENLILGYTASETTHLVNDANSTLAKIYAGNDAKFFHIHPFGYSEEHGFLKAALDHAADKNTYLLPAYCKGGELFIGLENTEALQQITLLFQVLEGSENPLTPSFSGKQKIEWSVLGNNEWKALEYADILLNETDNLLQSGIFKFNLPKEATTNNTTLSGKYIWLKAKIHKKYDVVCKITGIHTQAVLAAFEDNGNELSHLKTGLEAHFISKLNQRISTVKAVSQPYNSFDYKPEESDADYYRRVSERLRHKNRAITMWDYEHIILQEFPELYKVKCLNHTSDKSYQAPGYVTLVVIPDTVNKNVFDIYQPRVSTATLNKVREHVAQLHSMHVTPIVMNPNYEEVTVDLKVKFKPGFDESFYTQELNTDITKFLSPWAFDKKTAITFGIEIHISALIYCIEKLPYIDYLQDVKLLKNGTASEKIVKPSNPKSILISAKSHFISTNVKGCSTTLIEPKETCQL